MSILSRNTIVEAVESGTLGISPFSPDGLQPASYDMRLHWRILVSPTRYERGQEIDLRKEPSKKYAVAPGRFLGVLTTERLVMPFSICGRFGLRSEFTRRGLVAFGGIQIDPGYRGRLSISLFNAGPEPIPMIHNAMMFTVEFHLLDAPVDEGYSGIFQNQNDFHPLQRDFILRAHTTSLSEINALPAELSSMRQQLMVHKLAEHPIKPAKTLEELAVLQGVRRVEDPESLLGGWPEDEDFDEFMSVVKASREGDD